MENSPQPAARFLKPAMIALLILGLALTLFFGLRALRSFMRVRLTRLEPGVRDVELIRGWMTIPYIARSYNVPEEYLYQALNVSPDQRRGQSLSEINREIFPGQPQIAFKLVKTAILQYYAAYPAPSGQPGPATAPPSSGAFWEAGG